MVRMLPRRPTVDDLFHHGIRDNEYALIPTTGLLWRVYRTASSHALAWNELRTYGPVLRFDPHPLPRGDHPGHGVWYGATDVHGALAEAFQATRTIDRLQDAPYLTGLHPARELRLLDVGGFGAGRWSTRIGGTFALYSAPHGITQRWARTIAAAHPRLDGLLYRGRFSSGPCAALFPTAADAFPVRPATSNRLAHPGLQRRLAAAAEALGYTLV
ncbi:RES domain-containing protein [Rhodococcus sp. WS4]|nr:RES domain-containing protein [Rhodococcus sp. WS4]